MTYIDDTTRLRHMRTAASRAVEIAAGADRGSVRSDSVETLAIAHLVEVLGEAANAVSPELKARHPELPWRQMVGARNRIIHGYHNVDIDVLWRIVEEQLPRVIAQIDELAPAEGCS